MMKKQTQDKIPIQNNNITENRLVVRCLGRQNYLSTFEAMREFTQRRCNTTNDEIWLLEHDPVFTQGQSGDEKHLVALNNTIPMVQSNRGGQVTYHGPGQLMIYTLIDLQRKHIGIRTFVTILEDTIIALLAHYGITGHTLKHAPGVYVHMLNHNVREDSISACSDRAISQCDEKIASIGLRVHRGCTYHGIALNIDMDLNPFSQINPCGFAHLKMTQLSALGIQHALYDVGSTLIHCLCNHLNYQNVSTTDSTVRQNESR